MTSAGDLQYRVDCQKREQIDDGYGNPVAGPFVTQFSVRAAYKHLRGGEGVLAARLENRHPLVVTIRSSLQSRLITAGWQLVDARDGSIFAVRDVTHETDRAFISLLVEKGAAS